jgi:hypothetical protein
VDWGFPEDIVTRRCHTEFVREGQYGAEVDVELIDAEVGWSPLLSLEDAQKLDGCGRICCEVTSSEQCS